MRYLIKNIRKSRNSRFSIYYERLWLNKRSEKYENLLNARSQIENLEAFEKKIFVAYFKFSQKKM